MAASRKVEIPPTDLIWLANARYLSRLGLGYPFLTKAFLNSSSVMALGSGFSKFQDRVFFFSLSTSLDIF